MINASAELGYSPTIKSNWPIILLLLLMGAVPALPGAFIVGLVLQGPPPDGVESIVKPHYFITPVPIILHALAGLFFAALAPFQFAPRIRQRWPKWHRRSGRVVFFAGYMMALSAFWMLLIFPPAGGFLRTSGLVATGAGMVVAFGLSLHAIMRQRNFQRHRAWLMRALAITYGAVGPALFLIPSFFVFGESPAMVDEVSRWLGMTLNLVVVERILRQERLVQIPV